MEIFKTIAVFFHLMGFASLFGVSAIQIRSSERIARNGMMHGALTQLVSGLVLVALKEPDVNHIAIGIKLLILVIIIGILDYYRHDKKRIIPTKPFFTVFALTLLEVVIAVVWLG